MVGYGSEALAAKKAVGIRQFNKVSRFGVIGSKLWVIKAFEDRKGISFKFDLNTSAIDEKTDYKEIITSDAKDFNVWPVADAENAIRYAFVFRKRSVNLLHVETGYEIKLVLLLSNGDEDCISGGFIKGTIPNVELHYFESKMDFRGEKINQRFYNIFKMHPDFWTALDWVRGRVPYNQHNIRKISHANKKKFCDLKTQLDNQEGRMNQQAAQLEQATTQVKQQATQLDQQATQLEQQAAQLE